MVWALDAITRDQWPSSSSSRYTRRSNCLFWSVSFTRRSRSILTRSFRSHECSRTLDRSGTILAGFLTDAGTSVKRSPAMRPEKTRSSPTVNLRC